VEVEDLRCAESGVDGYGEGGDGGGAGCVVG
jgi:hypothetical protein